MAFIVHRCTSIFNTRVMRTFAGTRTARPARPAVVFATSSDSSQLFERSERSEGSEFGDGPTRASIAGQSVRGADPPREALPPPPPSRCPTDADAPERTLQ